MKCDFCGTNLTIDDEFCPYCHSPNTHYVKHREDMHRYEQDYQDTKKDVYETAGKTSKKATQIAVLAVLGILFLGTIILNTNVWSIEKMLLVHKIEKNLPEHIEQLDTYIQQKDWHLYSTYVDANELYYSGVDELEDYRYFQRMVNDYTYIYDACMHLVDYGNIDQEYAYYTPDRCMEQIADSLKDMYEFVKADEYSTYYELYQAHRDWCDPLLEQTEELLEAYIGLDPQVVASGEIRNMSKTKLVVLLEGSYNRNES